MKAFRLILAIALALPLCANAQVSEEVQKQGYALKALSETLPFRNDNCRRLIGFLGYRGFAAGWANETRAGYIGLSYAQVGKGCSFRPKGFGIFEDWAPRGSIECRDEVWVRWSGVIEHEVSCRTARGG